MVNENALGNNILVTQHTADVRSADLRRIILVLGLTAGDLQIRVVIFYSQLERLGRLANTFALVEVIRQGATSQSQIM